MERIVLFRWLALVPGTFLVTGISSGLFMYVLLEHIKPFTDGIESDALYLGAFTSFASIIWLLASYNIAPNNKKRVLWVSFVLGCLLTLFIFSIASFRNEFNVVVAIGSTFIIGLVTALILHFGKEILNEIER